LVGTFIRGVPSFEVRVQGHYFDFTPNDSLHRQGDKRRAAAQEGISSGSHLHVFVSESRRFSGDRAFPPVSCRSCPWRQEWKPSPNRNRNRNGEWLNSL